MEDQIQLPQRERRIDAAHLALTAVGSLAIGALAVTLLLRVDPAFGAEPVPIVEIDQPAVEWVPPTVSYESDDDVIAGCVDEGESLSYMDGIPFCVINERPAKAVGEPKDPKWRGATAAASLTAEVGR